MKQAKSFPFLKIQLTSITYDFLQNRILNFREYKRRPDIIYKDSTGCECGVNVGITKADGSLVTREQKAMDDLNNAGGLPTTFEKYD